MSKKGSCSCRAKRNGLIRCMNRSVVILRDCMLCLCHDVTVSAKCIFVVLQVGRSSLDAHVHLCWVRVCMNLLFAQCIFLCETGHAANALFFCEQELLERTAVALYDRNRQAAGHLGLLRIELIFDRCSQRLLCCVDCNVLNTRC